MTRDGERRPGRGNQGAAADRRSGSGCEHNPAELLAEAHRLTDLVVAAVRQRGHRIPAIDSPSWWAADDAVKVSSLLILAEGWLLHDCDRVAVDRLKAMALDLSAAHDWSAASRRPSYAELRRRRGEAA